MFLIACLSVSLCMKICMYVCMYVCMNIWNLSLTINQSKYLNVFIINSLSLPLTNSLSLCLSLSLSFSLYLYLMPSTLNCNVPARTVTGCRVQYPCTIKRSAILESLCSGDCFSFFSYLENLVGMCTQRIYAHLHHMRYIDQGHTRAVQRGKDKPVCRTAHDNDSPGSASYLQTGMLQRKVIMN